MDDLIARAQQQRDWHLAQAARLETFLATAYDLEQELRGKPQPEGKTDAQKAEAPKRQRQASRPQGGVGLETINAAEEIVRERGPMSTRDMLPFVRARGIEVGGRDPVATLSARLSGRGDLIAYAGKWYFDEDLPPNVRLAKHEATEREAADNPGKDQSTASLFQTSQGGSRWTRLS